jgi:hypothetical protein
VDPATIKALVNQEVLSHGLAVDHCAVCQPVRQPDSDSGQTGFLLVQVVALARQDDSRPYPNRRKTQQNAGRRIESVHNLDPVLAEVGPQLPNGSQDAREGPEGIQRQGDDGHSVGL